MKKYLVAIIYHPLTRIIIGIAVCFCVPYFFKVYISKPLLQMFLPVGLISKIIQHTLSILIVFASYYLLFSYYEKRPISEFAKKYMFKEVGIGFVGSFSMISFIILLLFLLGNYRIIEIESLRVLILPFFSLVLMALLEEVLFRGIAYRILEKWLGTIIALVVTSLMFGIGHITNNNITMLGITGAVIGGLVVSIMYTYTKRLWVPFAFHLGWNFAQIIYGSNLSGMNEFGVFIHSQITGPVLLVGSKVGIEDSLFALSFTTILFVIFLLKTIKRKLIVAPSWIKIDEH